jgi:hypothetical protein
MIQLKSATNNCMIALKDEETTLMSQTVVSAIGLATHAQHLDESYGRSSYQAAVEWVLKHFVGSYVTYQYIGHLFKIKPPPTDESDDCSVFLDNVLATDIPSVCNNDVDEPGWKHPESIVERERKLTCMGNGNKQHLSGIVFEYKYIGFKLMMDHTCSRDALTVSNLSHVCGYKAFMDHGSGYSPKPPPEPPPGFKKLFTLLDDTDCIKLFDLESNWSRPMYGEPSEQIPQDAPEPPSKSVNLLHYVDAHLQHDMVMGHSVIGTLHPIDWFSKGQAVVETYQHGFTFLDGQTLSGQVVELQTTPCFLSILVCLKNCKLQWKLPFLVQRYHQ